MAAGGKSRNRNIQPIANLVQKRNTKSKRTKVLIKKTRELSILCNLDINVSIYDSSTNKLQQFTSKDGFTVDQMFLLIKNESKTKMGTNGKKFKMRVVNCSNTTNTADNDSDDSEDEP